MSENHEENYSGRMSIQTRYVPVISDSKSRPSAASRPVGANEKEGKKKKAAGGRRGVETVRDI